MNKLKGFLLAKKKLVIIIVILAVGIGIFILRNNSKDQDIEQATIERGNVREELILSGEVKADEHVELTFSSSGKTSWIGVKEGDEVYEGQALAKLDTTKLNADYQRALSDLRDKEAILERVHDDVKDNDDDESYTEKESRTTAEVAKDKAYEAVLKAKEDLDNATLFSPFAGIATYVAYSYPQVSVLYTEKQVEIVNPDTFYFEVTADQDEVIDLAIGQKVTIMLDSQEKEIEGEVAFIAFTPSSSETGTVYEVKVAISTDSLSSGVRVGMTGDARFILSEKEDVMYVPSQFLNQDTQGKYLNLNKKNSKLYVKTGVENEDIVEIIGDVNEGDIVYD